MNNFNSLTLRNPGAWHIMLKIFFVLGWSVCLSFSFFLIDYRKTQKLQHQLQKKQTYLILQINKNRKKTKALQKNQKALKILEDTFQQLKVEHSQIKTLNQFVNIINEQAKKSKLIIQQIKPLEPEVEQGIKLYTLLISMSGQYQNFLNFLQELEQKNYFLRLKNLEIKKNSSNNLVIELIIQTIYDSC